MVMVFGAQIGNGIDPFLVHPDKFVALFATALLQVSKYV
jgi:hypothetical protein